METQVIILILRVLLSLYGEDYNPKIDWFILTERSNEKIVFLGDFKNVDEIILCDNQSFNKCGFQNKQVILIKGQTQMLIQLDTYPFTVPDKFYVHTLANGRPTHFNGYPMRMGFIYDRIYQLEGGY
jgi:hypothetical protein